MSPELTISRSKLSRLWNGNRHKGPREERESTFLNPLDLPQEVIDYIVDFLHDDKSALQRCSVLSHQWNHAVRYHLFFSVKISGKQRVIEFTGLMRNYSTMTIHIRKLRLNGQYPNLRPIITPTLLASILESLPYLDHLSLFHVHHVDPKNRSRLATPKARFKLQFLELAFGGATEHHTPNHFLDVIGLFSTIDTLSLQYPRFKNGATESNTGENFDATFGDALPRRLCVRVFIIDDVASGTEFWIDVLRRTASANTLSSVQILTSFPWDPSPLGSLLAAVGPKVESLRLDVSNILTFMSVTQIPDRLNLASCTGLKHLSLRMVLSSAADEPQWDALCILVTAIAAHNVLETFTLSCNAVIVDRGALFRALSASHALRTVTLVDNIWHNVDERIISATEDRLREHYTEIPANVTVHLRGEEPRLLG